VHVEVCVAMNYRCSAALLWLVVLVIDYRQLISLTQVSLRLPTLAPRTLLAYQHTRAEACTKASKTKTKDRRRVKGEGENRYVIKVMVMSMRYEVSL
jgi:hypothetical protein